MKKILLLFLLLVPAMVSAENEEKEYVIYNIFSFSGSIKNEGFSLKVDDGVSIEKYKDENGKKIVFNTPAAALMYLASQGWEMYVSGATVEGGSAMGTGSTDTSSYWIMRKKCSKEEFESALSKGRMK